MRTALSEVKESVGNRRADLVQLWSRGQQVEEMIKLMDQMFVLQLLSDHDADWENKRIPQIGSGPFGVTDV